MKTQYGKRQTGLFLPHYFSIILKITFTHIKKLIYAIK